MAGVCLPRPVSGRLSLWVLVFDSLEEGPWYIWALPQPLGSACPRSWFLLAWSPRGGEVVLVGEMAETGETSVHGDPASGNASLPPVPF